MGAFGELPENHFSLHTHLGKTGPAVKISGIQGHNSNSDAKGQYELARYCDKLTEAAEGVDVATTNPFDWRGILGDEIITDICDSVCGGKDARKNSGQFAQRWSPVPGGKSSTSSTGMANQQSKGADWWPEDDLTEFSSTMPSGTSVCESGTGIGGEPFLQN